MAKQLTCLLVIVLGLVFVWAEEANSTNKSVIPSLANGTETPSMVVTPLPDIHNVSSVTTATPASQAQGVGTDNTTTTTTTTTTPPTTTTPNTTTTATTTTTTTTAAPNTTTTTTTTTPTPTTTNGTTTKPTTVPTTTEVPPQPKPSGGWGWGSFFAGIVFTASVTAVAYVVWKFYKARTERNYHTLSNNLFGSGSL